MIIKLKINSLIAKLNQIGYLFYVELDSQDRQHPEAVVQAFRLTSSRYEAQLERRNSENPYL